MIETRPARYADAVELSPRLRPADADEIASVWRIPPLEGLVLCLLRSERAFSLTAGGQVVGLWGVSDLRYGGLKIGLPWMLAAEELFSRQRELARRSRHWVDRVLLGYDALTNLTRAANRTHLRWLAWCGFEALRAHPAHGAGAVPLCEFYRVNRLRQPCEPSVRETLLARDVSGWRRIDSSLLKAAGLAARMLDSPGRSAADRMTDLLQLVQDGSPGRDAHAPGTLRLLFELAGDLMRRADGAVPVVDAGSRLCRQVVAVAETCSLEPGCDPVEAVLALARVPAPAISGGPAESGTRRRPTVRRDSGTFRTEPLVRALVSGLTLSGRVSRVQGRLLRLAALGIEPGHGDQAAGVDRDELSALWSDRAPRPLADRGAGGERDGSYRLWQEAGRRDGLSTALRDALQTLPSEHVLHHAPDVLPFVSTIADRMSRAFAPGVRCAGVSTGYLERQRLYWLLRAWLAVVSTGSADLAGAALAEDLAALLLLGEVESKLLGRECRAPVEDDHTDLLIAIERLWPAGPLARCLPRVWARHVRPVALLPTLHVAQLEPALIAWYLADSSGFRARLAELVEASAGGACASAPKFRAAWQTAADQVAAAGIRPRLVAEQVDDARNR